MISVGDECSVSKSRLGTVTGGTGQGRQNKSMMGGGGAGARGCEAADYSRESQELGA